MLLLNILWDDWPSSGLKEQRQQQLEYIILKPDCHSRWISKMQSDTLEKRYAIKFCFKLGKNPTETYRILQTAFRPFCMNRASVFEWHKSEPAKTKQAKKHVGKTRKYKRNVKIFVCTHFLLFIFKFERLIFHTLFLSPEDYLKSAVVNKMFF